MCYILSLPKILLQQGEKEKLHYKTEKLTLIDT